MRRDDGRVPYIHQDTGNDLSSFPTPWFSAPSGDKWCLCAARWAEANSASVAPKVVLEATSQSALKVLTYWT